MLGMRHGDAATCRRGEEVSGAREKGSMGAWKKMSRREDKENRRNGKIIQTRNPELEGSEPTGSEI